MKLLRTEKEISELAVCEIPLVLELPCFLSSSDLIEEWKRNYLCNKAGMCANLAAKQFIFPSMSPDTRRQ